jgi:hypothetical protein
MLARLSHESYILLEFRRYHLGALIFIPVFWGSLDRVQKKTVQFTNHMKDCDWETLA